MTQVNRQEETYYDDVDVIETEPYEPREPVLVNESVPPYEDEYYRRADLPPRKLYQLIWLIAIIVEVLIGFRVFLKLIGANPESGFASFIYGITAPILAPFAGLTSTPSANGAVFEISSIIAMVVYAILFWLATYVIRVLWDR